MFEVEVSPLLETNGVEYCNLWVCEWNFKLKKKRRSNYSLISLLTQQNALTMLL